MLTFAVFDPGFRRLCAAFGLNYSEARAKEYFENIQYRIEDEFTWHRLVSRLVQTEDAFPKVATLLRMKEFHRKEEGETDEGLKWVTTDCKIVECVDGFISVEINGCDTVYLCPKCPRANNMLPKGYPRYSGPVTLRTDEEMRERYEERVRIHSEQSLGKPAVKSVPFMIAETIAEPIGELPDPF